MSASQSGADIKSLLDKLLKTKKKLQEIQQKIDAVGKLDKKRSTIPHFDFDEKSNANQGYIFDLEDNIKKLGESLQQGENSKLDIEQTINTAQDLYMVSNIFGMGLSASLNDLASPPGGPEIRSDEKDERKEPDKKGQKPQKPIGG